MKYVDRQFGAAITATARSDSGFNYPKYHEIKDPRWKKSGRHPFILPTVKLYLKDLKRIVGDTCRHL